jgi:hypothetical protein
MKKFLLVIAAFALLFVAGFYFLGVDRPSGPKMKPAEITTGK